MCTQATKLSTADAIQALLKQAYIQTDLLQQIRDSVGSASVDTKHLNRMVKERLDRDRPSWVSDAELDFQRASDKIRQDVQKRRIAEHLKAINKELGLFGQEYAKLSAPAVSELWSLGLVTEAVMRK